MNNITNTFAVLMQVAERELEEATSQQAGSFHRSMVALVFAAFTWEAFVNHVGHHLLEIWDETEKLKLKEKMKKIYGHLNRPLDLGKEPLQSAMMLSSFRDSIAHGKTCEVTLDDCASTGELAGITLPQTLWESQCTPEKAAEAVETVKEAAKHVSQILPSNLQFIAEDPFMAVGQGGNC